MIRIRSLGAACVAAAMLAPFTAIAANSVSETQEVLVLRIRVVHGEGLVNAAGGKGAKTLVVQLSDETGRPVAGAKVSFRLPENGPGGTFRGGLTTDIAITGADGQAAMGPVQWNRTPGPFQIRVVAAKDRARSGMLVAQYLAGAEQRASHRK